MNFGDSIKTCLSKYADFNGRASRSEYWWFMLFAFLICAAGATINDTVYGLVCLVLLLPHLSVAARRLHDLNKSTWWLLLFIVPIANILLLIWFCMIGTIGANQYGSDSI
jgi:uncharacterized membrane protein YhaH (DUF805 family)